MKQKRPADPRVEEEASHRLSIGCRQLTIAGMATEIRALGYRFVRALDCHGVSRHLTGARAGATYPACNLYLVQIDDGMAAFHYQARRDDRFRRLQALRHEIFAVHGGRIYGM